MKNGDVFILHQILNVEVIKSPVDEISETADPTAVVNILLLAATCEGELTIGKRPVNLLGSTKEGEGRTVFTDTLHLIT